ncbi:hypothetical protein HPK19_07445 [Arthrobacter citreus]|nr:hypothetical protein HPK19_07445 [Arthrobacter citreus]
MITIYIDVDDNNNVVAFGTSPVGSKPIQVQVDSMEVFDKPDGYKYINGRLIKDENYLFELEKQRKINELDNFCTQGILDKFTATIDGVQYQFSNSQQAQGNFDKILKAFERGYIQGLKWTAYDMEGNVVRVPINAQSMETLYVAHLTHIQNSIVKFRDILQPQVEKATTTEQLNLIVW